MITSGPIEVAAFEAANSRAYLRAVFDAWSGGCPVMVLPEGAGRKTVPGTKIATRESFVTDPGWFEADLPERPAEERALIAFSSGTTGRPKAILIRHGALQDVVRRINAAMGVDNSIREYLGVPVTYSFGFGRARAVAAAGGRAFLPEHGFDPGEINQMLASGEINAVSAVPTLWRVILANRQAISAASAEALRRIEIGSQWMSAEEKLALRRLFPNARIVQHYGLTEASRTTLLDITEASEDRLDSVGRAEGEVKIAIDGKGRIRTRGPHLAEGVVSGAGVKPVTDADGWLTTADRGRIEDGWLYYEGRVDELINAGGLKIDPTAFEQAVNTALGVPNAVAAGRMTDPLRGEKVLVALDRAACLDRARVESAVAKVAEKTGLQGAGAYELREVAGIPLTGTSKVKRAELAELDDIGTADAPAAPPATDGGGKAAELVGGEAPTTTASATGKAAELQTLWGEILGQEIVPMDKSFYDLGGDSLSALTAIVRMEALGIEAETARGIFEGKTIAELVGGEAPAAPASAPAPAPEPVAARTETAGPVLTLAETVNSVHAARGVLVLWIVVVHWLPAFLARLGERTIWIYDALIPALRFGTPGFAMVFGMGVGALGLCHYQSNPELFRRSTRFNTKLIVSGVLMLAAAKFMIAAVEGTIGDRIVMSSLFYSAITYYALAMLTLPWIVRLLVVGPNRLLTIALVGAGAMILHEALNAAVAQTSPGAFLEFLKLTFAEKYGYFRMTGFVMAGVAIGWLLRRYHGQSGVVRDMALYAAALAAFGAVGVVQNRSETPGFNFHYVYLWHFFIYAGTALIILAGFAWLNRAGGVKHQPMKWLNSFAIASGILALPIFVGHELILALKQLADALGVPDAIGLLVLLGIFFGVLSVAYKRLMKFL